MKDSGVEWIGMIPEDWSIVPLRFIAQENKALNTENLETKVLSLSYGRIIERDTSDNFGLLPESFSTYQKIAEGNIILRLTDLQNDKRSLRVGFAKESGIITSAYVGLVFRSGILQKYFYYLLHAYDLCKVFYNLGGGVRQSLKWDELKWLPLLSPPKEIQENIVDYLDKKIENVDHVIEQKRKLIDLLKEKRTSIINHAMTRGLDKNVELVDSGVEWIGKVPKGWRVERLKSVANINRDVLSEDTPVDYVINYLDIGDVESNGSSFIPTEYTFENAPSRARRLVHDGTVILATVRTYLKAISYIENPVDNLIVSTGFATLDANGKVIPKYLYYLASSELIIQNVVRYSTGVSYPAIAPTVLGGLPVIYPTVEIQKQIITHLDESLAAIDSAIEKIQTSIRLLNEYRTSLISHVVTGKVEIYDRV